MVENILVLILNDVMLSVQDFFPVIFDNTCMERTWISASYRDVGMNMLWRAGGGGLKFCVCVRGTFKKSVRSRKRA